ncbi:unnamed protein product, partial [Discosporangium mesarthrocarpum]
SSVSGNSSPSKWSPSRALASMLPTPPRARRQANKMLRTSLVLAITEASPKSVEDAMGLAKKGLEHRRFNSGHLVISLKVVQKLDGKSVSKNCMQEGSGELMFVELGNSEEGSILNPLRKFMTSIKIDDGSVGEPPLSPQSRFTGDRLSDLIGSMVNEEQGTPILRDGKIQSASRMQSVEIRQGGSGSCGRGRGAIRGKGKGKGKGTESSDVNTKVEGLRSEGLAVSLLVTMRSGMEEYAEQCSILQVLTKATRATRGGGGKDYPPLAVNKNTTINRMFTNLGRGGKREKDEEVEHGVANSKLQPLPNPSAPPMSSPESSNSSWRSQEQSPPYRPVGGGGV